MNLPFSLRLNLGRTTSFLAILAGLPLLASPPPPPPLHPLPTYTPMDITHPNGYILSPQQSPEKLPGQGLAAHDFFYAGEAKQERLFIVRAGQVIWSYEHPAQGEISDATLYSGGNVLFAHQHGVTEINTAKQVLWNFDAPTNTEIHTAQHVGPDHVLLIENGNPAKLVVMNTVSNTTDLAFDLPAGNPKSTHGQFRHARLTDAGTLLVAHMDLGKVCEYDTTGKVVWSVAVPGPWSATPLKNGNILVCTSKKSVLEINRDGQTVWEFNAADARGYLFNSLQIATRLANGNTLINNWFNQWSSRLDPNNLPVQAIEVTPDKKIVWALRSWDPPADLGPSTTIQLLDEPLTPEDYHFGEIH